MKKLKTDIDKLNSLLNDKKEIIKALNQRLLNILNNTNATSELIIHNLDLEVNEFLIVIELIQLADLIEIK